MKRESLGRIECSNTDERKLLETIRRNGYRIERATDDKGIRYFNCTKGKEEYRVYVRKS